jgi:hypothetical protein
MSIRRGGVAALLVGASLIGCTAVGTDPDVAVSVQFDSLPALAVVVGDTMRGDDLLPAKIPARGFSGGGSILSDSQVRLIGIDSSSIRAFRVIDGFRILGLSLNPSIRVVAQAGLVQSQTQTFAVVPAPTRIFRVAGDSAVDTLVYSQPDTSLRFRDVRVRVVNDTSAINGLRVRFRVVAFSAALLDSVRLLPTAGGRFATRSALTVGPGDATVRVRAFPKSGAAGPGTVTLEAALRVKGAEVPGSPLQFTVRLTPFTLSR